MSDPVNSSDEAVEAAVRAILAMPGTLFKDDCHADHIQSAGCPVCKGDVPAMVREAYPIIAAAVRAEAVADAQRQIESAVSDERRRVSSVAVELAKLTEQAVVRGGYREGVEERVETLWQQLGVVLAAGSVPVATPEPTVEIGGQVMTVAQYNAAQFPFLKSDPGPVSVPKESSE